MLSVIQLDTLCIRQSLGLGYIWLKMLQMHICYRQWERLAWHCRCQ
jgi:hypothetical protein